MNKQALHHPFKWLLMLSLCLGTGSALAAKYYKWVDEDGVTHYSAQPPAAGKGEVIKVQSGASSDKDAAMKRLEERRTKLEQNNRSEDEKAAQAEAERLNREANQKQCEQYQKNLTIMTQNPRVKLIGADGEARMLPEEERQERMKKAREFIKENCN
ncbi:MAG: DUF4124 domain-containing protein [Ketobacteraceae bacterium]|nr:DUF4124 domain-containing protein [Ketobacteraceae bacterium]